MFCFTLISRPQRENSYSFFIIIILFRHYYHVFISRTADAMNSSLQVLCFVICFITCQLQPDMFLSRRRFTSGPAFETLIISGAAAAATPRRPITLSATLDEQQQQQAAPPRCSYYATQSAYAQLSFLLYPFSLAAWPPATSEGRLLLRRESHARTCLFDCICGFSLHTHSCSFRRHILPPVAWRHEGDELLRSPPILSRLFH